MTLLSLFFFLSCEVADLSNVRFLAINLMLCSLISGDLSEHSGFLTPSEGENTSAAEKAAVVLPGAGELSYIK